MFQVLVSPAPTHAPETCGLEGIRSGGRMPLPMAGLHGVVNHERVAVFARLEGQRVRCASGALWITVENDREDHVLAENESMVIPAPGKVIIGGQGGYEI